jgi:hypothetical protein
VDLVAEQNLEAAVEDVEGLVLVLVDVRRRAAARAGFDLEQRQGPAGRLGGGLEGHGVSDDPEPFAGRGGHGVWERGGGGGGVHRRRVPSQPVQRNASS